MTRNCLARVVKTGLDLIFLGVVFFLAFFIRFEGILSDEFVRILLFSLPVVIVVKFVFLALLRVPRQTWHYVSLLEVRSILVSIAAASVFLGMARLMGAALPEVHPLFTFVRVPLGVLLIDFALSLLVLVALRTVVRLKHERVDFQRGQRKREPVPTLLIGAGRTGALVAREIAATPNTGIRPVGFLEEGGERVGTVIHGVHVLGTLAQMPEVVHKHGARQALICMDHTSSEAVRRVARACENCHIPTRIIPGPRELMEGIDLAKIRDVAIEDLLGRDPVRLDCQAIAGIVRGRRVIVTGAGGSIGSELCREVCRFAPATLVLVEQAENSLFFIHRELIRDYPKVQVIPCVADICDEVRMDQILADFPATVLFHAAAHKHVPMMEANPGEAVKNNILGTRTVADLAHAHGVGTFVMISTDKAVNPTSVMGASKRVAEIYVQALSQRSSTRFVAVRFGNVLGSNGSVIPIFKEQIARGGPVTVTHPDMKRYFMTIPEACQLVLQAAAMGRGGEIFVLDMGEPVKIVDLAQDLIRLSGLAPEDIPITFTGLRPGEKLFEELSFEEESAEKTQHPRIFIGRIRPYDLEAVNEDIDELGRLAEWSEQGEILAKLKEMIPEYQGSGLVPERLAEKSDRRRKLRRDGTAASHARHARKVLKLVGPNGHNKTPWRQVNLADPNSLPGNVSEQT